MALLSVCNEQGTYLGSFVVFILCNKLRVISNFFFYQIVFYLSF